MKKYFILLMAFFLLGLTARPQKESKTRIFKFDIKEEIAPPVWRMTQKAFEQAKDTNADLVLIHMNTYGGMLESADSIRTIILQSEIPVYVFIDNNAASAGALISIACDSIYMRKGGSIGAATVVNQTGEAMPDKYQSYMRSMMRSTAEAAGRDPEIAQAMVDPRIAIPNVIDSGKVLTFTTSEAIKYGFCEGEAENIREVLAKAGIEDYEIIEQRISGIDKIIGFLISPMISGILIMIIIGGIYFELQSPGLGFPSAAAVLAALLYFAPLYIEGLAANWEILIFIVGLVLIAVEIFAIPGFGIPGITGITLLVTALALSLVGNVGFDFSYVPFNEIVKAFFLVIVSIFLAIIGALFATRKMLTTTAFGNLALADVQRKEDGFTFSDKLYVSVIGKEGVAKTVLRPSGKVLIDDEVYDATALSGFIDKGSPIIVRDYVNGQLMVRKKEQ
ncbi:MAG: NfeD family protein [Bacteroidota bacterium]|nr:NfeD family protein [Bacteroidota bacterium]